MKGRNVSMLYIGGYKHNGNFCFIFCFSFHIYIKTMGNMYIIMMNGVFYNLSNMIFFMFFIYFCFVLKQEKHRNPSKYII